MTEYDYSPEGFERYMKTQERVQKWVHRQAAYAREYDNPFIPRPATAAPSSSAPVTRHHSHRDASRGQSVSPTRHTSSSAFPSSRPTVHRSATLPPNHPAVVQPVVQPSSRHSRTHSHAPPPQPVYQQTYYQSTSPVGYTPPSRHSHGKTTYQTYTFDPNAQIVLPPPKRGDTYIIVPPTGRRVEVVQSPSSSRSIKKPAANKPLLKRLLTLGSTSGGASSSPTRTGRDRRGSY